MYPAHKKMLNQFLFLFSGHDSSVRLWNLETKTCIQEITAHRKKFDESIFDVAFHPSRPYIASAGADALAKVFVWKVDKNCKETPKMMKKKSNRKTLNKNNSKQNNWIRARSEYNALSCDILWQFFVSNSTLCDTYYVALYLKARSAAGSRWLLTPKNKREKKKKTRENGVSQAITIATTIIIYRLLTYFTCWN